MNTAFQYKFILKYIFNLLSDKKKKRFDKLLIIDSSLKKRYDDINNFFDSLIEDVEIPHRDRILLNVINRIKKEGLYDDSLLVTHSIWDSLQAFLKFNILLPVASVILIICFSSILFYLNKSNYTPGCATSLYQEGTVQYTLNNKLLNSSKDFIFKNNCKISTKKNSLIDISFGENRTIRMKSQSELIIDKYLTNSFGTSRVYLSLVSGSILTSLSRLRFNEEFIIKAADVKIKVVGTIFWVSHIGNTIKVDCYKGSVQILYKNKKYVINDGQKFITSTPPKIDSLDDKEKTAIYDELKNIHFLKKIGSDTKKLESLSAIDTLIIQARDAINNNNYNKSMQLYMTIIGLTSDKDKLAEAYFNIGKIKQHYAGRYEEAANYYSRVIKEFPNSDYTCDSIFNLGECLLKLQQVSKSKIEYQKLLNKYNYNICEKNASNL